MVTYINKVTSWEHPYMEYRGLSTDTKPTDAPVNAKFVELDTGVEYYFSEGTWNIAPSPSGDGSGSSGAEKFVVTLTADDSGAETVWAADKTVAEIVAADAANQVVVCRVPFADYNAYAEIPCWFAQEGFAAFEGLITFVNTLLVEVQIFADGGDTEASVRTTPIPTSSNEKFVVTLTQENDTWTADKTVAEIVAADAAGKIVAASVPSGDNAFNSSFYITCSVEEQGGMLVGFSGIDTDQTDTVAVLVSGISFGGADDWAVTTQPIPTSSNEPLVVTLTPDETTGLLVGDQVCSEVYQAFAYEHRPVIMRLVIEGQNYGSFNLVSASLNRENESIVSYNFSGFADESTIRFSGAPSSSIRQITD